MACFFRAGVTEATLLTTRLNTELRGSRRGWLWTAIAAVVFSAMMLTWFWTSVASAESRLLEGVATGTRPLADDEKHLVLLMVDLDGGQSVAMSVKPIVAIGSRVIVNERTTLLGRRHYTFVRVARTSGRK